nr:uncharacterized protein K02A2.6-like [Onthophagus taurus]
MAEGANRLSELSLEGNLCRNWQEFKQKFEIYLKATDKMKKSDDTKVAILLNLAGEKALTIYNNQLKLEEEEDKDNLAKVIQKCEEYCNVRKNVVYERFLFMNTIQKEGQGFDSFVMELKVNAKMCEFLEEDALIRDRIIFGVRDKGLQQRLLSEEKLDLETTVRLGRTFEASKEHQQLMDGGATMVVDAIQEKTRRGTKVQQNYDCKKCGKSHSYGQCPAYGKVCAKCGNKNHFAVGCKLNKTYKNYNKQSNNKSKQHNNYKDEKKVNKYVKQVENKTDNQSDSNDDYYIDSLMLSNVCNVKSNNTDAWLIGVTIDNVSFKMKLDTGATCNILPKHCLNKLYKNLKLNKCNTNVIAFGGNQIDTVGAIILKVLIKDKIVKIKFIVVNVQDRPILGLKVCEYLGLLNKVNVIDLDFKAEFIKKYNDNIQGIGEIPGTYKLRLKQGSTPVIKRVRRVPEIIKDRLKETLNELIKKNIIEEVEYPTDWVNQITIVEKNKGKLPICLDPTELNKALKLDNYPIPTISDIEKRLSGK